MAGESPEVHFDSTYWTAVGQGDPAPELELAVVIDLQARAAQIAARLERLRGLEPVVTQNSDDLRNAA
jgi:hypothetical protein